MLDTALIHRCLETAKYLDDVETHDSEAVNGEDIRHLVQALLDLERTYTFVKAAADALTEPVYVRQSVVRQEPED